MLNIIFPTDEKTKYIRTITDTIEDYEALASCYNSFKDSDSWPGGFGGALIFTSEYIKKEFQNKDLSTHFIINDPNNPAKIVGAGYCNRMWNLPNGWYVVFLGVDPIYQKQKFGRALLWNATEFATKQNAQMITLHTWSGNIKAMPLYKRQGYKWRPNTSVYMENYIPQILNYSNFLDFFSKYCWYDIFKPVINQEPNNDFIEKMAIYDYHFSADKQNQLKVWIDRTIGRINGFHKCTSDGENFYIKASTPNSEAFIGFEKFPIVLELKNKGNFSKTLLIKITPSSKILVNGDLIYNIQLPSNTEKKIELTGQFKAGTDELDTKIHTHTYSNHLINFNIKEEEFDYSITIGKVPLNAITVLPEPKNFTVFSDSEVDLVMKLQNSLGEDKEVELLVSNSPHITLEKNSSIASVSKYDSIVEIPIKVAKTKTTVDLLKTIIRTIDGKTLIERELPIIVFNKNKAVTYEYERELFVENKNVRIGLYKAKQPGNNEVVITDKLRGTKIFGHPIILGYPFDNEGSEFYTLDLTHEIKQTDNGIWLYSSADSKLKPGIKVTRKLFLPDDNDPLGISWKIENISNHIFSEDLGIQVRPGLWNPPPIRQYVYPLQEGIRHVNVFALPISLGKDPNSFTEGWKATEFSEGTIGVLFDHNDKNLDNINISSMLLSFEFKINRHLNPGEKYQFSPIWYIFVDKWQQVRKVWQDKYQYSPGNRYIHNLPSVSHKQFGLLADEHGKKVYHGLFIDRSTQSEINIGIDAFRKTTFKGNIKLNFKNIDISQNEFTFHEENARIWSQKVRFKPKTNKKILEGNLTFDTHTRFFNRLLALGLYASTEEISINDKKDYLTVNNGYLTFKGSAKYKGTIFYLSLNEERKNLLLSHFPELKTFLWWNEFYGGIRSIIRPENWWSENEYNKLQFEAFEAKNGLWKGIGFRSDVMNYSPRIKGLQNITLFLTLPDSPFILVQQIIENHSEAMRYFNNNINATFQTSNSNKDHYFVPASDGSILNYRIQDYESNVWLERDPYSSWAAYLKQGEKYYITALLPSRKHYKETISPYSPNFSLFMHSMDSRGIRIGPKETKTFNMLIFLTDSLQKIKPFTKSNLNVTLRRKN